MINYTVITFLSLLFSGFFYWLLIIEATILYFILRPFYLKKITSQHFHYLKECIFKNIFHLKIFELH